MRTFLAIDGTYLSYRNLLGMPPLTRKSDDLPTGAAIGFANKLHSAIVHAQPTHGVCVFDSSRNTFRKYLTNTYKSNREKTQFDESALLQIKMMHDIAAASGLQVVNSGLYEADDVLASCVTAFKGKSIILAGDKDMLQLVSKDVSVLVTNAKGEYETRGPDYVKSKWGIDASLAAEYQALTGDGIDNIGGVPKIGTIAAASLLNTYGSIEKILENAFEIKNNGQKKSLAKNITMALHSRRMTRLQTNLFKEADVNQMTFHDPRHSFISILKALEADAAVKRVAKYYHTHPDRVTPNDKWRNKNLHKRNAEHIVKSLFG